MAMTYLHMLNGVDFFGALASACPLSVSLCLSLPVAVSRELKISQVSIKILDPSMVYKC